MSKRLLLAGLVASLVASSAVAQEAVRLQFELYKNDSIVGRPSVTVHEKETGTLTLENVAQLSFTPSRIDAEKIAIAFNVIAGEKSFRPRLVLQGQQAGSISWKSATGADSFELRVSSVR